MKNPLPTPEGSGAYLTVNLHGAEIGPDGITRGAGNGISVTASPLGLARLLAATRPVAVHALLMFLHEGQVTVIDAMLRIEVEGWGREWLLARGYSSSQAQDAIRDLRAIGWIRTEQTRGQRGWVGIQVGVLSGSVYGSGDVHLAAERRNRAPLSVVGEPVDSVCVDGTSVTGQDTPLQVILPDGLPVKDRSRAVDNRGSVSVPDGSSVTGQITPSVTRDQGSVQVKTVKQVSVSGETLSLTRSSYQGSQSFQDLLTGSETVETPALRAALATAQPAVAARPEHAQNLLSGIFLSAPAEHPTAAAVFLDLPADSPALAAASLASHLVAVLADPAAAAPHLRALARSKNVVLSGDLAGDGPTLGYGWVLAVASAATTHVADMRRYLYSALHRPSWQIREPLPRLGEAVDAIVAGPLRTRPAGGTDPQVPDEHLDAVLAVMAGHFDAVEEDVAIWRRNPRLRGRMVARFTIENGGLTPAEMTARLGDS